ncbi:hypothetical protein ACIP88_05695 [Streptomyces uncialis]|uniref:hypothetical protein n=1 Tax=Streptomyces uncialis TaxID=1048205 RepID=UPI0037FB204D
MLMTSALPSPLHTLDAAQLTSAAMDRRWPKWQTMALLHSLKLPVLNACLITPDHNTTVVRHAVRALSAATGTATLMIRSDGGVEKKKYHRGGNTFPIEEIPARSAGLLAEGRAVILAEPTNRFTNRLTVLIRMDRPSIGRPGSLTMEALGPGYDAADLTRGHIPPQVTAHLDEIDFDHYQPPRWHEWKIIGDRCPGGEDARRQRRLGRLAHQTLTDSGHLAGTADAEHAEAWLRKRGFLQLFAPQPTREALAKRACRLFEDAFLLALSQPNRNWHCLATAFSVFAEPRTVYWDLVDGERKYSVTAPAAARNKEWAS